MDLLIILTYTAICVVIFKVFKIPLNKWSVPTAVLGGVFILSAILMVMNYNHPYAKYGKEVLDFFPYSQPCSIIANNLTDPLPDNSIDHHVEHAR